MVQAPGRLGKRGKMSGERRACQMINFLTEIKADNRHLEMLKMQSGPGNLLQNKRENCC